MQTKLINAVLTSMVVLGGFTGTLSLGWYFFWGETKHGGEYPMALHYYREYLRTGDIHLKESAEIHRSNANTLSYWGFLSAQLMATGLIGVKLNNK
mgnify:FL=1|jgi:hypothetical protein|tara:strand:- start:697 stop:984 length:288 start_codon:yes stop_codon:yes gene_type:complete